MDEAAIDDLIRKNNAWQKLSSNVKQVIGTNEEYDRMVVEFSMKNQLRYRGNLVRQIKKNEKLYYEELLKYSREHLMLFPYHLSDFIITGMRITPFQYYVSMMHDLIDQEKSYDTLPNFSAADCLRLLQIGRNQYIDIMNACRSSKKFLGIRRKPIKDLLPARPAKDINIEPWWLVFAGYITEDDVKLMVTQSEKDIIDKILSEDFKVLQAGDVDEKDIRGLYLKGLIYLDVPVEDDDLIVVPPLEGFVMNRVTGDYFETLLYKIFVSIDENTTVSELSSILQVDLPLVKNAVSMYCRLGFAYKKSNDTNPYNYHPSWRNSQNKSTSSSTVALSSHPKQQNLANFIECLADQEDENVGHIVEGSDEGRDADKHSISSYDAGLSSHAVSPSISNKRIGMLYDSTLAAFLMMGNLSPGLKNHAVTMFEVGKLTDESIDSLLNELSKINEHVDEETGEAERYFIHAVILHKTVTFLRNNARLSGHLSEDSGEGLKLDLIRCESLMNLDAESCQRLLHKNYKLLISVSPLSNETKLINSNCLPHLGPPSPVINSIWFKLYLYHLSGFGPPSLLLAKGARIYSLPKIFNDVDTLLITPWGRDSITIPTATALYNLNDHLTHSALLVQGYVHQNSNQKDRIKYITLPVTKTSDASSAAVEALSSKIAIDCLCGYITLVDLSKTKADASGDELAKCDDYTLLDLHFGIPLFDKDLNRDVCNSIIEHDVCRTESLEAIMQLNHKMCLDVESFIAEHHAAQFNSSSDVTEKYSKHVYQFPPSPKYEPIVPLPSCSLSFYKGNLKKWNFT